MSHRKSSTSGLRAFRRAIGYLKAHLRPLIIGLTAAIGVSLFYTVSVSSVIPLLKVIFSDHETLADWLNRTTAEYRLGVALAADVPDDPAGFAITNIPDSSPNAHQLSGAHRLAALKGESATAYTLLAQLAHTPPGQHTATITDHAGNARTVQLTLREHRWWTGALQPIVGLLPAGRDPVSRSQTLGIVMTSLILITLLGGIFRLFNEGLIAVAVQRALHNLRSQLGEHVLRLPVAWHATHPVGDTLARFATDINKIESGLTTLFGRAFREPLKAAGVLALTLAIDWRLLALALLGLPIGLIVMGLFGKLVKRSQRRASQSWGRLLDHLGEKLAGIRVVKSFGMERDESARFEREGRELTRAQTHIEWAEAATKPALETLAMLAVAGFVMYGGARVFNQQLEPQLFFGAVVCLAGVFDPIRKLGKVNNRINAADASAARIFELLDLAPEPRCESLPALPALRREIRFENISFAYPANPDQWILRDLSLTVPRGQVVALVGPNGSGKTTLMALLLRFFEPTRGRILFDNHDIAQHTLASLRGQIGLVTQDAVVFHDSVARNLAYGSDAESDLSRLARAARRAHIDDFLLTLARESGDPANFTPNSHADPNLPAPGAYDLTVDARSLSGGQRQRFALARAILREPEILVLDEATSQVDLESEKKIQAALEDVTRDRTTFIIAHRYSTIARADLTVVLNEGRIVATGRHSELLESSPFYMNLCETQLSHGV